MPSRTHPLKVCWMNTGGELRKSSDPAQPNPAKACSESRKTLRKDELPKQEMHSTGMIPNVPACSLIFTLFFIASVFCQPFPYCPFKMCTSCHLFIHLVKVYPVNYRYLLSTVPSIRHRGRHLTFPARMAIISYSTQTGRLVPMTRACALRETSPGFCGSTER